MKAAIQGSAWPWHQDFGSWHLDGIAEPQLTTMVVMLDEATEFNGCLYLLPGGHREGRHRPYWDGIHRLQFMGRRAGRNAYHDKPLSRPDRDDR